MTCIPIPFSIDEIRYLEFKAGWIKIDDNCPEKLKEELQKRIVKIGSRYTEPLYEE